MVYRRRFSLLLAVWACARVDCPWAAVSGHAAEAPAIARELTPAARVDFNHDVRPILANHCLQCHGPDSQSRGAGLRLDIASDATESAIHPGDPAASPLIRRIEETDVEERMPPEGGVPLSPTQIAVLRAWIAQGANYADHWAFTPIADSGALLAALPASPTPDPHPIDRFLERALHARGLDYAPAVSKPQFLRRLALDLIGLPPTWAEIETFRADDSPQAEQKVIARLLASPRYAERWGRHWLDVARYADTRGGSALDVKAFPFAYTYRDYVVHALAEDVPFDRFIVEQIAADQLGMPANDPRLAGLGFLTVGMQFANPHDTIDDQIDVVSRGLMGITVSCARCHDHKFDPISTEDYYSLYASLAPSRPPQALPVIGPAPDPGAKAEYETRLAGLVEERREYSREQSELMRSRARMQVGLYLAEIAKGGGERDVSTGFLSYRTEDLRPLLFNRWLKYLDALSKSDPVFGIWIESRAWGAIPEDEFQKRIETLVARCRQEMAAAGVTPEKVHTLRSEPPLWNPIVLDAVADRKPRSIQELAQVYGVVFAEEHERWLAALLSGSLEAAPGGVVHPDEHPEHLVVNSPAHRQLRKHVYGADSPLAVADEEAARLANRTLADLMSHKHELIDTLNLESPGAPARAMVVQENARPDDYRVFVRGNPISRGPAVRPRFPAVLDHGRGKPFPDGRRRLGLAQAIVAADNPLTARVIVNWAWQQHFGVGIVRTPDDFGTRGLPPTHPELLDYLADEFRKHGWSLKWLHGHIVTSRAYHQAAVENASHRAIDPENRLLWRMPRRRLDFEAMRDSMLAVAEELDLSEGGRPVDLEAVPTSRRRSIYGFVNRDVVSPLMSTFDVANPNACTARRPDTTVPQQALFALNSDFIQGRAVKLAELSLRIDEHSDRDRIVGLVRRVLGRDPETSELETAERFLATESVTNGDSTTASDRERRWAQFAHALLASNEFTFID